MAAAAKLALRAEVISRAELLELAKAERKYADTQAAASDAERMVKALRSSITEKALGLTSEQLKQLTPDEVRRLFALRLTKNLWTVQRGAPVFSFEEASHGKYPAWKALYTAIVGEGKAARVQAETSSTYSYRVKVEI